MCANLRFLEQRIRARFGYTIALIAAVLVAAGCGTLVGYERIEQSREAQSGSFTVIRAVCPPGKKVLGGGFHGIGDEMIRVTQQFPQDTIDGQGNREVSWQVGVINASGFPRTVTAYALCAR